MFLKVIIAFIPVFIMIFLGNITLNKYEKSLGKFLQLIIYGFFVMFPIVICGGIIEYFFNYIYVMIIKFWPSLDKNIVFF